jgi:hypothetical protein
MDELNLVAILAKWSRAPRDAARRGADRGATGLPGHSLDVPPLLLLDIGPLIEAELLWFRLQEETSMARSRLLSWIAGIALLVMAFSTGDAAAVLMRAAGDCPNLCMSSSRVDPSGIDCIASTCPGNGCTVRVSDEVMGQFFAWCGCDDTTQPECCIALETWEWRSEPLPPHWEMVDCSCVDDAGNSCNPKTCKKNTSNSTCGCQ